MRERERESERERERESERVRERESERGAPSYEPSVQGDTKRERKETKVFPATTQASKDTPVKKRRESERERERERERECSQLRNKRPGTHQRGAGSGEGGIN